MSDEMSKRLEKIDTKLDDLIKLNGKQDVQIAMITTILDKNTESLITHEKRTTVSEERQSVVEDTLTKHLSFVKGAMWLFGILFVGFGFFVKLGVIKL